jgi:hypothetical protein
MQYAHVIGFKREAFWDHSKDLLVGFKFGAGSRESRWRPALFFDF